MNAEADSEIAVAPAPAGEELLVQQHGFLIELSLDWIVLRASENVDRLLGESHVTLIDEPLAKFVQAQPLHDLRNLFSRLSGTTGVARAYRVRLTDDGRRVDLAFQISGGRVLLEGTSSPDSGIGETIGSVVGLIDGLDGSSGQSLIDAAARRLRALTGFDSVSFVDSSGAVQAESRRAGAGSIRRQAAISRAGEHSRFVADVGGQAVPIFPRSSRDQAPGLALLRAPTGQERDRLLADGIGSTMRVPVRFGGKKVGCFECDHRSPRRADLELHAAAELFAQMFAMRLRIAELGG